MRPDLPPEPLEHGMERIQVIELSDFLALELPPRDNILAPWLPSQGLAMIYAGRGIGKTFLALAVAFAIACGGKFLRWSAPRPRGVLYLDGEMPAAVLQARAASMVAANELEPLAPFRFITPDLQPSGMIDLSKPDDQEALTPYLRGIDLIIVDNISTLCRTGTENEAEGWISVQEWALRLRSEGKSVLFIHHAGKGGNQRGTSKREDVLDTVIALRRPAKYDPEDGAVFEVHFEKSRGFYGEDAVPFEARLMTDEHGRQTWATRSLDDSTFDKVVDLARDENLNATEIAKELGVHKSTVSRHLKKAKALGLITAGRGE